MLRRWLWLWSIGTFLVTGSWAGDPEDLAELLQQLGHTEFKPRHAAIDGITELGPEAEAAIPALLDTLRAHPEDDGSAIALALKAIGPAALEPTLDLLEDSQLEVRRQALMVLRLQSSAIPPTALPKLRERVLDADEADDVRSLALTCMRSIGPASEVLPAALQVIVEGERYTRASAAWALGVLGGASPEAVAALHEALGDEQAYVRKAAVQGLGRLGPAASAAVEGLVGALEDEDEEVRQEAAVALAAVDRARAKEVLRPELRELVRAREVGERVDALKEQLQARAEAWIEIRLQGNVPRGRSRVFKIYKQLDPFLSRDAKKGFELKTRKTREAFAGRVLARGALGSQTSPGYALSSGKVLAVRIGQRLATVRLWVQAANANEPQPVITTWIRGGDDFFLRTAHDELEELLTAEEMSRHLRTVVGESSRRGLEWLAAHQASDGRWSATSWYEACGRCSAERGWGDARFDAGVTALALLAFSGAGHTESRGDHQKTVGKAMSWLRRQQTADGAVGYAAGHGESIYNHALATRAFCVMLQGGDDPERRYAEKAVQFCVKAQNPGLGWEYGVRSGRNDTSVTAAMTLALATAKRSGIDVPDDAFTGARRWFERATDKEWVVGYETPGGGSSYYPQNEDAFERLPTMNAAALVGRLLCGERRSEDANRKGARMLLQQVQPGFDDPRRVNYTCWLYAAEGLALMGGNRWINWRDQALYPLVEAQRFTGMCDGMAWEPSGEWCLAGGRVYATASTLLILQVLEEGRRRR